MRIEGTSVRRIASDPWICTNGISLVADFLVVHMDNRIVGS